MPWMPSYALVSATSLRVLLTDDDVATLKHLANEDMSDNILPALASDLGYVETWCRHSMKSPLPWPAKASC